MQFRKCIFDQLYSRSLVLSLARSYRAGRFFYYAQSTDLVHRRPTVGHAICVCACLRPSQTVDIMLIVWGWPR